MLTRKLIGWAVIVSTISCTTYFGVKALVRAFKNYANLSFVRGTVTDTKMIKQMRKSKYETRVEDILVLSIEGTRDQFGFTQSSDAFKNLLTFRKIGKTAEIYYDPNGKRIQGNVFLHPFDVKIGEIKIIDIEKSKKRSRNASIFFLALSFLQITLVWIAVKGKRKEKRLRSDDPKNFSAFTSKDC